ncbi:MAG: LysM peptidoglycan-binding domain-containing protein [Haloechinothrix sp.]
MSVLVEEQVAAGRKVRTVRKAGRPVRRTSVGSLRRPPAGVRVDCRPRRHPVGCAVERPMPRWRLVAALVAGVCGVIVVLGVAVGGLADGARGEVPSSTMLVTVLPGQTLWDVATTYAPGSDPRAVVRRIAELNGLTSDSVPAGYPLSVPVRS